jgi:hypothetical protein
VLHFNIIRSLVTLVIKITTIIYTEAGDSRLLRNVRNSLPHLRLLSLKHSVPWTFQISVMDYFCSKTNEMHQFLKFILLCSSILRVSDGLSVHNQETETVHTASGICQTDSAD